MGYIRDAYDEFREHDRIQNEQLSKCPTCEECRNKITDKEFWKIGKKYYCFDCVDSVELEDFIGE